MSLRNAMTLRTRLTLVLLATIAALLVASGVGLWFFMQGSLQARFDDGLAARADALITATTWEDDDIDFDFDDAAMAQYERADDAEYFELVELEEAGATSRVIDRSPSLNQAPPLREGGIPKEGQVWDIPLPDGRPGRALARRFRPRFDPSAVTDAAWELAAARGAPPGPLMAVIVAKSREDIDAPLSELLVGLLIVGAALGIATATAVRLSLRQGLRPLEAIARRVQALDLGNLDQMIDVAALPAELRPVQDRLNELLARLQSGLERERRFTTAAAHELRTPVSELRAALEVASARPRSREELRTTVEASLAVVERLSALVHALVRLSRLGSGREALDLAPVDLAEMVRAVEAQMGAGRCHLRVQADADVVARVDEAMFRVAIENLLRNAIEYGDRGRPIEIAISRRNGMVAIDIDNPARGVSAADMARIGEPFWRHDAARTDQRHLGIGVHLARVIATAMGGEVVIAQPRSLMIRATLAVPACDGSPVKPEREGVTST